MGYRVRIYKAIVATILRSNRPSLNRCLPSNQTEKKRLEAEQ